MPSTLLSITSSPRKCQNHLQNAIPDEMPEEKQDRHSFMSCLLGIEFVVIAIRLRLAEAGEAAEREAEGLSACAVLVDDDTTACYAALVPASWKGCRGSDRTYHRDDRPSFSST
jgi:hypothetical protein